MAKYTNARYPDKINDLIDNDGNINPEVVPASVFVWNTEMIEPISDTKFKLYLREEDFFEIAEKQPLKITMNTHVPDDPDDVIEIDLVYKKLINAGVMYNGHGEDGTVYNVEMYYDANNDEYIATLSIDEGDEPGTDEPVHFGSVFVGDSPEYNPSEDLSNIIHEMMITEEEQRINVPGSLLISDGSNIVLRYTTYATIGIFTGEEETKIDVTFESSFGTIDISIISRDVTVDLTNFLNPFSSGSEDYSVDIDNNDDGSLLRALSEIAEIDDTYTYDRRDGLCYTFYVKNTQDAVFNRDGELFKVLKGTAEYLINVKDDKQEVRKVLESKIYYWLGNVPFIITNFRLNQVARDYYTMECDLKYRYSTEYGYIGVIDTSISLHCEDGEDTVYTIIINNTYGVFNLKFESSPK